MSFRLSKSFLRILLEISILKYLFSIAENLLTLGDLKFKYLSKFVNVLSKLTFFK